MSNDFAQEDWFSANQRHLGSALARVRLALEAHARGSASASSVKETEPAAQETMPERSALDTLCDVFGLSSFERDVLLICAGMELDARFIDLCAKMQNNSRRPYPTFSLALAALSGPHWSAIVPTAPLRYWRLIEIGPGETLTNSPLKIDERILHFLAGISHVDERLIGLVGPVFALEYLPPSHEKLAERITNCLSQSKNKVAVVQLCGEPDCGSRAISAVACARIGFNLQYLCARNIPPILTDREMLIRLWEREAILTNSVLLLDCQEMETLDLKQLATEFIERMQAPLIVTIREPLKVTRRPLLRLDVNKPSLSEQRELWQQTLGSKAHRLNGQLNALVAQFSMSPAEIADINLELRRESESLDNAPQMLWDACRARVRVQLDDLAQRIVPAAGWDDLVLPKAQHQILREIVAHVRQRTKVYNDWGFAARSNRGFGISALFSGSSGTGKTMAAEVMANELHLDLYRIDLSAVVSKYIGETEKNLRRVFDAAEAGGVVLLFDEADALFGKRSEVKDSHDRYANIEVSYLLQRMESYRGLAILTTNMKQALDSAFLRRIRFIVHFPFPDAAQRAEIWKRIFPASVPNERLNLEQLAQLNVAGGDIRNIVLSAAFLAADEGSSVSMRHLLQAARSEYTKLERPLTNAEIGGWV